MKMQRAVLLLLLGLIAFAAVTPTAYADEDDGEDAGEDEEDEDEDELLEEDDGVEEHPLTDMPMPSPDVTTAGTFPNEDMTKPKFAIGKQVDALVGIINNGEEAINVTSIMGSLNSPFDFNYYIQNFSGFNYNTIVQEGEEYSFHYRFQTAINLDPVDYQVCLTVFYENEDELFSHNFFNGSVAFYEEGALVDVEKLFKYVGGFAAAFLLFTMAKNMAMGSSGSVEMGTSNGNSAADDDFSYGATGNDFSDAGRTYANRGGKRRASGKKNR